MIKKILKFFFPKTTQAIFYEGGVHVDESTRILVRLNGRKVIYMTVHEFKIMTVLNGLDSSCLRIELNHHGETLDIQQF